MSRTMLAGLVGLLLVVPGRPVSAQEVNVLGLGEGTIPIVEPPCYGGWTAANLLDDAAGSGWACEEGRIADNVFVFELPTPATISTFEFDTQSIDGDGRAARNVVVEVSATSATAGFTPVLEASLVDRQDGQRFPARQKVEGSWVRLKLIDNHGDEAWTELMGFRGLGTRRAAQPAGDISGTYATSYGDFHMRQQGTALTGCYEHDDGLFDGTVEGRVMKLTWVERDRRGPAVFVFTPDGTKFQGYWWYETDKDQAPAGTWEGTRTAKTVGSCPHWSGSVSGELHKSLADSGRARLYGILFDTDSAKLRGESLPTLDEVVKLLADEPAWKLTIEGHTDATGTAAHNQTLSEARARSVQEYLVSKGVAADRLATAGFGQSKPVADNATELGRAQNRRVELVRN